ncbi:hypothetical protein MAR_005579 [Mya arenaria]|uniref:Uncharacterized protein n=1 Tax=Mya arenaria TaxID=6604 RepID=A0ABY7F2R6_MYAAR|nr:hypothetical protein MAR_005579 [Mya arenaria]
MPEVTITESNCTGHHVSASSGSRPAAPFAIHLQQFEGTSNTFTRGYKLTDMSQLVPTYNCLSTVIPVEKIDVFNPNKSYNCPKTEKSAEVFEAPTGVKKQMPLEIPGTRQVVIESPGTAIDKLAKYRVNLRRRKMRLHRRLKQRVKIWPKLRKVKFLKDLKKKRIFALREEKFNKLAEDFDAMEYIMKNLNHARTSGYHVNVFKSKV